MEETNHNNPTSSPNPSPTNSNPTTTDTSPTPSAPKPNDEGKGGETDNTTPVNNNRSTHHQTFTNNGTIEHSDSTMSNPVNDKVDTSEKSNDSTNENSAFDLSYFDEIYKTKEKDDPLDLSYFESPYDKNKLEDYLKSNVESGNQLAYTAEDATNANQVFQNAKDLFFSSAQESPSEVARETSGGNPLVRVASEVGGDLGATNAAKLNFMNDINNNVYGNTTSKEEVLQSIREKHPLITNSISNDLLNAWAESVVASNKSRQIAEDLGRNGPTANSGITKAEELDLMNRAASDYSSLSDAEKEMAGKVVEYAAAHPNALNQPINPFDTPANNRAREERNQRLSNAITAVNEAREAERREAERARETTTETETPTTPATSTAETPATETSETATETETTETPTTEARETTTETEDEIPEEIEEPSEETRDVMDAIEGLDDSGRWWEFGSEDYERTRHQIARISPTAEEEFMDFADLINDIVNGSAGNKIKAVLKLVSKAAWDTFNILPKVCVDVAKDIVYRLIKGDYDTSGLTEGEQKQVERFSHNKQNVNMMNVMLNTMDKPIESSIRGKGRGQATDESDYNEGLIEQTNNVTSDVNKKYIINNPWIFKAIQRW